MGDRSRLVSDLLECAPGHTPRLKGGCGQNCPPHEEERLAERLGQPAEVITHLEAEDDHEAVHRACITRGVARVPVA